LNIPPINFKINYLPKHATLGVSLLHVLAQLQWIKPSFLQTDNMIKGC